MTEPKKHMYTDDETEYNGKSKMTETLTKRTLLNILEQVEMDAPIQVNVQLDHIVKDGKARPITRLSLSNGAGIGGKDNGVLLSTTPSKE